MRSFTFPITPTVIYNFKCPSDFFVRSSLWFNIYQSSFPRQQLIDLKRLVKQNKNWILKKKKALFVYDPTVNIYYLCIHRVNKLPFTHRPSKSSFQMPSIVLSKYGEFTLSKNGVKSSVTLVDHSRQYENSKISTNTVGWITLPKNKRRLSFNNYKRRFDILKSEECIVLNSTTGSTLYTSSWRVIGLPLSATSYDVNNLVTTVQNRAVTANLIGMKNSNVNLLNALGEGKETIHLLLTAIRRLCIFCVRLKHGDYSGALKVLRQSPVDFANTRKHVQSIGSSVLEIQYGWRPLIQDIQGFMKQLDTVVIPGLQLNRRTVKDLQILDTVVPISSGALAGCTVRQRHKITLVGRSLVLSEIKNLSLVTAVGFGLTNPLSLAWELTPWSFVVDWFLPVGKALDSLDSALGRIFKAGSDSWFYTVESEYSLNSYPKNLIFTKVPVVQRTTFHYQRALRSSFPSPKLPTFKDPFSSQHLLNSLALIDSSVKKR